MNITYKKLTVFLLIFLSLIAIAYNRAFLIEIFNVVRGSDVNTILAYLRKFGNNILLVTAVLVFFQGIGIPFPSFIITIINSLILGWYYGAVFTLSVSLIAATLAFFIARFLGRDAVVKIVDDKYLTYIDNFFKKYGLWAIFIARLIPFISFPLISYFCGINKISYRRFIVSTIAGRSIIVTLISYIGIAFLNYTKYSIYLALVLVMIAAVVYGIKYYYKRGLS